MKILLLGATGRTGKLVLKKAIERGFCVNCLSRNSYRIEKRKQLNVFEGDPTNKSDLETAITGCNAVISVLNISRSSDFPWAKLSTPKNYLSNVMSTLVAVSEQRNIKRIVLCSAWGVAETKDDIPLWFKWLIDHSNIGFAYQDHERQEKILAQSELNWTIIRPVGLTNSTKKQDVRESFDNSPTPNLTISRISVANYMIDTLDNDKLINQKVVISKD